MARRGKNTSDFDIHYIMNDPAKAKQLNGFIDETMICMRKIASEREAIGDIRNEAVDQLGIPAKLFNDMVRTKYNDDLDEKRKKMEMLEEAMSAITGE